jgi:hypothetical protein
MVTRKQSLNQSFLWRLAQTFIAQCQVALVNGDAACAQQAIQA